MEHINDLLRRVEVSDPSTDPPYKTRSKPTSNNSIVYADGRLDWVESWMLDPGDDAYPFVEWEDLDDKERAWVLGKRCAWMIEQEKEPLEEMDLAALVYDLETIATKHLTQQEATDEAFGRLNQAIAATRYRMRTAQEIKARLGAPLIPARTSHLMAEGSALRRVQKMVTEGSALNRKVSLDEPANAFTMLNGDRIAKGGEMLTGCTITDTKERLSTNSATGATKVYYEALAVSL